MNAIWEYIFILEIQGNLKYHKVLLKRLLDKRGILMKIKLFLSKFLLVIATATLFAAPLAAEISVANFRGLASVLKPEHEYLSPIHGALLWKNNYIENLYRYGDQTSETLISQIKELFDSVLPIIQYNFLSEE